MSKYSTLLLLILMLPSCVSEHGDSFQFRYRFLSPKKKITTSYCNYLESISKQNFPIFSFQDNADQVNKSDLVRKFRNDKNLQYLPATLWQLSYFDESLERKNLAENFSDFIQKSHISYEPGDGELIHTSFLTPYQISGDPKYFRIYMESLDQLISGSESSGDLDFSSGSEEDIKLERFLENELFFFATQKTGDPIYRELALELSDQIYHVHFQSNPSNEVFYGLANWNTLPQIEELEELESCDLYKLSLSFYSFAILYQETDYEKYGAIAVKLTRLFTNIFEGDNVKIKDKFDMTSKVLVCLAMSRLSDEAEELVFDAILADLNMWPEPTDQEYSFRMYFYLFECLKNNDAQ